jgi:hypothetical protein
VTQTNAIKRTRKATIDQTPFRLAPFAATIITWRRLITWEIQMKSRYFFKSIMAFTVCALILLLPLGAQNEDDAELAKKVASVQDEFSTMDLEYFLDVYMADNPYSEFSPHMYSNIIDRKNLLVRQCRMVRQTSNWLEQVKAFGIRENDRGMSEKAAFLSKELGKLKVGRIIQQMKKNVPVDSPIDISYYYNLSTEEYEEIILQLDKDIERLKIITGINDKITSFWDAFYSIHKGTAEVEKLHAGNPLNVNGIVFEQEKKIEKLNEIAYMEIKRCDRIRLQSILTFYVLRTLPASEAKMMRTYIHDGVNKLGLITVRMGELENFLKAFIQKLNMLNEKPTEEGIQELNLLIMKNRPSIYSNYKTYYMSWIDLYRTSVKPVAEVMSQKYSKHDRPVLDWFLAHEALLGKLPATKGPARRQ